MTDSVKRAALVLMRSIGRVYGPRSGQVAVESDPRKNSTSRDS